MSRKLSQALSGRVAWLGEAVMLLVSWSGATLAAVLGKLLLAAALAAVGLGIFLRLSGRRAPPRLRPAAPSAWACLVVGLLSAVEVALLVEATQLPVRFHQPGFAWYHWVGVSLALGVAYRVQLRAWMSLVKPKGADASS